MKENLNSNKWAETASKIRSCHLMTLNPDLHSVGAWKDAFLSLIDCIKEEREANPGFAKTLKDLTIETGFTYDFKEIFEEFFDHLEDNDAWDMVIDSANLIINTFDFKEDYPSEYMYRIGNALQKSGRLTEAEAFGKKWLAEYPNDLYAAASNVFLYVSLGKLDEAQKLTEKYLSEDLICSDETETIFIAAERLYELTDNSYAKERVAKKIAEYNQIIQK